MSHFNLSSVTAVSIMKPQLLSALFRCFISQRLRGNKRIETGLSSPCLRQLQRAEI